MELKPCPFCGGEAEFVKNEYGAMDVSCKSMNCRGYAWGLTYNNKNKAIEAWNKRVGDPEMRVLKLKPCPFCGDEAEMYVTNHIPQGYDYTPRCKNPNCCGRLSKKYMSEIVATDKWNLRVGEDT